MTITSKPIRLALQGGGSHGAFTWGVLDALLADARVDIVSLSGTSAGALNAVALASGRASAEARGQDGAAGARQLLAQVWGDVSGWGALQAQVGRALWGAGGLQGLQAWSRALSEVLSPYDTNPLDLNPLRDLLAQRIDFEAIRRAAAPAVFVSATQVSTGKAVIFSGEQLTAQAVLASACLPTLFPAVEIHGQAYWDGGYAVNPALTPLIQGAGEPDIVIVQINPLRRPGTPRSAAEINDRISELTFNASLLTQVRAIDLINQLIVEGALAAGQRKLVRLHRIDGGARMLAYNAASMDQPDPGIIRELFQLGRSAAQHWLDEHVDALGVRSTVDMQRDYLDDTRLVLPGNAATAEAPRPRPWLARWLRRRRRQP